MSLKSLFSRYFLLTDQEVPLFRAESQLRFFRRTAICSCSIAVSFGILLAYRWPMAKARALRILVERQVAIDSLAISMYDQGILEVTQAAVKGFRDESIEEDKRQANFNSLAAVRSQLIAHRDATSIALNLALRARSSLPHRLGGSTPWVDAISGQAFPADASRKEMGWTLFQIALRSPEQTRFLKLAAALGHPMAPDLATATHGDVQ